MASSSTCSTRKSGGKVSCDEPTDAVGAVARRSGAGASGAAGSSSCSEKVVPCPLPRESSPSRQWGPCCCRMLRTMVSPSPVPPLPCSMPRPTCVNASPFSSCSRSCGVSPMPESITSMRASQARTRALSPLPFPSASLAGVVEGAIVEGAIVRRTRTEPPRSVNLSAFETPLFTPGAARRAAHVMGHSGSIAQRHRAAQRSAGQRAAAGQLEAQPSDPPER
mmetsp:Transcript_4191/g.10799  ORF Transcript_4191/g.10799 Transcript_4191/m.10799 type:complete len:222 (+) Transcript_4191:540-1205(+)